MSFRELSPKSWAGPGAASELRRRRSVSPPPGAASLRVPARPPGGRPSPKPLLSSDGSGLKGAAAGPGASWAPQVPARRDVAKPQTDTPGAPGPRPRPRLAARPLTHLLARLGRRVVVGCGAGCGCHGVGQILGRSIRRGVIHHLRTTHGSRGSGGPGAAAALPRARAPGAAAAAAAAPVAAPAATAAKAGPRRPRAPCGARAREGLAIGGSPCAGTFIFSPSGGPLARAYIAAWGRDGPPRGGGMTGAGPARAAAPRAAPASAAAAAPRAPAAPVCMHTMRAPGSSYRRRCRLGEGRGLGQREGSAGEEGALATPGSDAERREVPPSPSAARGSPSRGTREGPAADWSEVCSPLRLPAVGRWWEGNGMREAPRPRSPVPTQSPSPGCQGEGAPTRGAPRGAAQRPGQREARGTGVKQSRLEISGLSPPCTVT